jgi:hypothetical protein
MINNELRLILQTVRLPSGTDQFVVPAGNDMTRGELQRALEHPIIDAGHSVIQPETQRQGTERLIALGVDGFAESDRATIGNMLHEWLHDVPSVIAEASEDLSHSTGGLPTSAKLEQWQMKLRNQFAPAKSQPTSSRQAAKSKLPMGLFAMLATGLLIVISFFLLPPFFQNANTNDALIKGDDANERAVQLDAKWNLTASDGFKDESDLLAVLRPLIASKSKPSDEQPKISDNESLAQILAQINHYRLGTSNETSKTDADTSVRAKNQLLADSQLHSDIRKLVRKDGTLDRLGLIDEPTHRDVLLALISKRIDERAAIQFRELALQLIGEAPIGESSVRLTHLERPFFQLADEDLHRSSFEALKSEVRQCYGQIDNRATFFTRNDATAAKQIVLYFSDIGFLADGKLGFIDEERSETIQVNADSSKSSSHEFAKLLIRWKDFANGSSTAETLPEKENTNPY